MMISPEAFYENKLKGKSAAQITTVIRSLKQEIGRLKRIIEHPEYVCSIRPSEQVRISCLRDYLEKAKQAVEDAGGSYTPSIAEQKAMQFDANIQYITKIVFCIGGYWDGYETKTYTIHGEKIHINIAHSLNDVDVKEIKEIDKHLFLTELKELHIGEWRRRYDSEILDGTQWELEFHFSNSAKPIKFYGNNAYPYNFDRAKELFY